MGRLMVVFAIGAVVALFWGGQHTYIALRDDKQLEITCAEYLRTRPDAHWLKLTECEYDVDHLAYMMDKTDGKITSVYLPLRPAGQTAGPTRIVVHRDDREMLDVVEFTEHPDKQLKPHVAIQHIQAQLMMPTEGLVLFGIDLSDQDKRELAKLDLGLDKDYAIVDYNSRPRLMSGLIVLLLGVGCAGAFVLLVVRALRKPPAGPNRTGPRYPVAHNAAAPTSPLSSFERPM